MNVLKEQDIHTLYNLVNGEAMIYLDDESSGVELPSYCIDPEKAVMKKESFQSLSTEAKEVVDIILNAPKETLSAITTKKGLLTKRSIRIGLQRLWKSKFIAKYVIDELTQWANKL